MEKFKKYFILIAIIIIIVYIVLSLSIHLYSYYSEKNEERQNIEICKEICETKGVIFRDYTGGKCYFYEINEDYGI